MEDPDTWGKTVREKQLGNTLFEKNTFTGANTYSRTKLCRVRPESSIGRKIRLEDLQECSDTDTTMMRPKPANGGPSSSVTELLETIGRTVEETWNVLHQRDVGDIEANMKSGQTFEEANNPPTYAGSRDWA
uniref:Uncharacterized protein n=1 Tax=Knipowitschia caucasica TaxID=637954 RepID=A0AAV2KIF3_KNICA